MQKWLPLSQINILCQYCNNLYWLHMVTEQNCDIFHVLQGVNANKCHITLISNTFYGMCFIIEKANSRKCCDTFLMARVLIQLERYTFIRKIVKTTRLRPKHNSNCQMYLFRNACQMTNY